MAGTRANQFEWDEDKRALTFAKHGIDFLDAIRIPDGRPVLHAPSDRPGEERWVATGKLSRQMISVVYTLRDDSIRIITARRARKNEQREYYKNHPGGCDPPER